MFLRAVAESQNNSGGRDSEGYLVQPPAQRRANFKVRPGTGNF